MNANELRIGNKLLWLSPVGYTVVDVDIDVLICINDNEEDAKLYEPIPLTPEILEKAGFVISEDLGDMIYYQLPDKTYGYGVCFDHEDLSFYRYHTINDSNSFEYLIYDSIHFQYLHQLQNLFFALCGEELQIKFP